MQIVGLKLTIWEKEKLEVQGNTNESPIPYPAHTSMKLGGSLQKLSERLQAGRQMPYPE